MIARSRAARINTIATLLHPSVHTSRGRLTGGVAPLCGARHRLPYSPASGVRNVAQALLPVQKPHQPAPPLVHLEAVLREQTAEEEVGLGYVGALSGHADAEILEQETA